MSIIINETDIKNILHNHPGTIDRVEIRNVNHGNDPLLDFIKNLQAIHQFTIYNNPNLQTPIRLLLKRKIHKRVKTPGRPLSRDVTAPICSIPTTTTTTTTCTPLKKALTKYSADYVVNLVKVIPKRTHLYFHGQTVPDLGSLEKNCWLLNFKDYSIKEGTGKVNKKSELEDGSDTPSITTTTSPYCKTVGNGLLAETVMVGCLDRCQKLHFAGYSDKRTEYYINAIFAFYKCITNGQRMEPSINNLEDKVQCLINADYSLYNNGDPTSFCKAWADMFITAHFLACSQLINTFVSYILDNAKNNLLECHKRNIMNAIIETIPEGSDIDTPPFQAKKTFTLFEKS